MTMMLTKLCLNRKVLFLVFLVLVLMTVLMVTFPVIYHLADHNRPSGYPQVDIRHVLPRLGTAEVTGHTVPDGLVFNRTHVSAVGQVHTLQHNSSADHKHTSQYQQRTPQGNQTSNSGKNAALNRKAETVEDKRNHTAAQNSSARSRLPVPDQNPVNGTNHTAERNSPVVNLLPRISTQKPVTNASKWAVTVPVSGRLGNKMFQYASLLGIAHMNGRASFFYGSSSDLQHSFNVSHIQDRSTEGFKTIHEKDFAMYDPAFQHLPEDNVVLLQYLQSWKYFQPVQDIIRQEFSIKPHVKQQAANLLTKLSPQIGNKTKVGIHVRRGDMSISSSLNNGYHIAPASYVIKAMDYMRKKHGDVIFILTSDDVSWCRAELKQAPSYVIPDWSSAEVHLALLASMDHVIMTVGTYGWWGGYLCGGDVVYYWDPKECLHHPPLQVEIKKTEDFFPPHWVPLPG